MNPHGATLQLRAVRKFITHTSCRNVCKIRVVPNIHDFPAVSRLPKDFALYLSADIASLG